MVPDDDVEWQSPSNATSSNIRPTCALSATQLIKQQLPNGCASCLSLQYDSAVLVKIHLDVSPGWMCSGPCSSVVQTIPPHPSSPCQHVIGSCKCPYYPLKQYVHYTHTNTLDAYKTFTHNKYTIHSLVMMMMLMWLLVVGNDTTNNKHQYGAQTIHIIADDVVSRIGCVTV